MSTTWDDIARDEALMGLHDEAKIERATQEQCIYLFVEGESEEIALDYMFYDTIDTDKIGVKIVNYNGHGNLRAFLKFLKVVIAHKYPIILTYDDEPQSLRSINSCKQQSLLGDLTYLFSIPSEPIVTYPSGHKGGSFEESFPIEIFMASVFNQSILPEELVDKRKQFESEFDMNKPWLSQVYLFKKENGFAKGEISKKYLAENLASSCDDIPSTYLNLIELIKEVREKHPVIHPDDVELPKVPGLTYSTGRTNTKRTNPKRRRCINK